MRHLLAVVVFAISLIPALPGSSAAGTMEDVISRGTLRVGIAEETFFPWVARDANGGLIGFEVDVAHDLATVLGVRLEFREFPYDDLLSKLSIGDVDVVVSAIAVTTDNARQALLSDPYGHVDYFLVVNTDSLPESADDGDYDIEGYKVGVAAGSVAETLALRIFKNAEVLPMEDEGAARDAMADDTINSVILPTPYPTYMMMNFPDQFALASDSLFATAQAVAVRPSDLRFINFINAWITENRENGRLGEARDYWFSSEDWEAQLNGTLAIDDEAKDTDN